MTMPQVCIVKDKTYLNHKPGHTHPEHPHRLRTIYKMIEKEFAGTVSLIAPDMASLDQLELVHTSTYIKKVLKTSEHNYTSLAPDTPASARTFKTACSAVGGCLEGLRALVSGKSDICFSLVRPPGHHALPDRAGGFCIFNNVGITARYAIKKYKIERILIIDWDVHHGNGVNDFFYNSKEILYISTHDKFLYPYTGDLEETGRGEGEGYTINIPVPREFQDDDFIYIYRNISTSLIERFHPQLILVCAGFDAHKNDPIGRSQMTEKGFGRLTRLFLDLRKKIDCPPVLFVLEGGYDFRSLSASVKEVLNAMTGNNHCNTLPETTSPHAESLLKKARQIHAKYGVWL
jgi:acetoin utilization deacetylase AcuC-like enzyme